MSMYEPAELLKRWNLKMLTVEQAVGQLVLRVIDCVKEITSIKATQQKQQRDVERRLRALEKRCP